MSLTAIQALKKWTMEKKKQHEEKMKQHEEKMKQHEEYMKQLEEVIRKSETARAELITSLSTLAPTDEDKKQLGVITQKSKTSRSELVGLLSTLSFEPAATEISHSALLQNHGLTKESEKPVTLPVRERSITELTKQPIIVSAQDNTVVEHDGHTASNASGQPNSIDTILFTHRDNDGNAVYRDFNELTYPVRVSLKCKIDRDFCIPDVDYETGPERKRHAAYLTFTKPKAQSKMVRLEKCLNQHLYHAGKDVKGEPDGSCKKCFTAGRVCVRMTLHEGKHKLCVYPFCKPGEHASGDWNTSEYWAGKDA